MKKQLLFFLFTLLSGIPVFASHIVGGEMIYEFISADTTAKTKKYRITLRLFRDEHCSNCALMPPNVWIGIFSNDTRTQYPSAGKYFDVVKTTEDEVEITKPECIINAPHQEYHIATYTFETDLPDNNNGYTASYQTCCRAAPLRNVENNPGQIGDGTGSTYACFIPGTKQLTATGINNSPQFSNTISTLCHYRRFTLDFSARDADGDQLVYSLSYAYNGGRTVDPTPFNPDPPEYQSVRYINNYSAGAPLGSSTSINPNTGIITGIAPAQGDYIVCVNINEYRAGLLIGMHRKDFIVNVADCDVAGAALNPLYMSCDGFSYTFQNLNNSPLNKTFHWEFGDGATSNQEMPMHTYGDTGIFQVKLIVNENGECGEIATSEIRVFPGFFPEFDYSECSNNPTFFNDRTRTNYGNVDSWSWNFGQEDATTDTSRFRNPTYTYPTPGRKNVSFVVTNSKGCVDTLNREILVLGRASAGEDTTVVVGQRLQLGASEGGRHTWLPATDLSSGSIPNPVGVYSGNYDSIRYKVLIFNEPNCLDSAYVTVRIFNTAPQVFVPTAFTPNGDGKNDLFRPVTAGMAKMDYFRVFNRWGQLVFSTTTDRQGWDGKLNGKEQGSGTFAWLVKGVDYTGKVFFAKGTVTLIR
jgi:gliding motility-associated-like protein